MNGVESACRKGRCAPGKGEEGFPRVEERVPAGKKGGVSEGRGKKLPVGSEENWEECVTY